MIGIEKVRTALTALGRDERANLRFGSLMAAGAAGGIGAGRREDATAQTIVSFGGIGIVMSGAFAGMGLIARGGATRQLARLGADDAAKLGALSAADAEKAAMLVHKRDIAMRPARMLGMTSLVTFGGALVGNDAYQAGHQDGRATQPTPVATPAAPQ